MYSTLGTQLLGVITKLTCCAMAQMFSSSFWRTNKISVKKSGCSLVNPEQRDTLLHYSPQDLIARGEEEIAFHTITGCDTASQFVGIGKQSALKIFDSSSKLIEHLGEHCLPEESVLADAEAFVCQLYNHGTDGVDINEERAAAFRKVKNLDSLASSYTACELPVHDMGKSERVSTIPV